MGDSLHEPLVLQVYAIISAKAHLYKQKVEKTTYLQSCCHVEGLMSVHEFFLSFHFEPLISVKAWNNLHRVFGRWLALYLKKSFALLGPIRLI